MNEELQKSIALELLAALSSEDVGRIIADEKLKFWFDAPENWKPYGDRPKNWDTVGNQQTNPVGAMVELITNGLDSILLRKAREAGIKDFRSTEAPHSMFEAVKRFFPHVIEGRIANLEPSERTKLADKCMIIGVKRADRRRGCPTYTLIDFGDGQLPQKFPETFLSLSVRNKEGIPFVQGKFNMGSTGSLRFCTRSDIRLGHYKLIISRRPEHEYWGWTLIRVRRPREEEGEMLPVAEYFCPDGKIPRFRAEEINAFGHDSIGVVREGSIIRLYEYDIGKKSHTVDFGLYDALTVNLVDCALPIQIFDFDAAPTQGKGKLRDEGIAPRTFGGMNVVLGAEIMEAGNNDQPPNQSKEKTEWVHMVLEEKHDELGHIKIVATAVTKLKQFLVNQPARVFYTVNGQTHAIERASFLNTRVGLGDLRNHILINVICDEMDRTALSTIFMPDRERKADTNLARMLEDIVVGSSQN